ncbi:LURP-one-related/scramblase family protein [Luteococcus sp. Sow4_B9]|uniref:LURP-one-related/scramblase family protein n=1 Tax=Luteococcus sp. Sow4_B9 TaxID=3438792 RepID=UPI003F99EEC4
MAILDNDVLVIDQVTSWLRNDFQLMDPHGTQVGQILTEHAGLARAFLGSRKLSIAEPSGEVVMVVDDVPNFGRDTFDLLDAQGQRFAEVVKQFTLFTKHLVVHTSLGDLSLQGSFWEREFEVTGDGGVAAQVSRSYPGIGAAFLGKERYVLSFSPDLPVALRAGTLGAVIALDLIREKERAAASSSS